METEAKLIAALVLALSLVGIACASYERGETVGRAYVQDKWDKSNLARSEGNNKAILNAVAANQVARQVDISQTTKVVEAYENHIQSGEQQVRADRAASDAQRMRFSASTTTVCPRPAEAGQAASPVIADGAGETTTVDLPAEIAKDLRDIAEDDDREINRLTAKITGLQDWVISHGFYGPVTDISILPVVATSDGKPEEKRSSE